MIEMDSREIKPITMPGIHERVYRHVKRFLNERDGLRILDAGAGRGAFTRLLHEDGFDVSACDLFPENFYYDRVECRAADITRELPYEDGSFDVVLLIEVMEHIHDHHMLFKECYRVLKNGGIMFFSTPNILSLKSRFRFLLTGFFYAFKPLDHTKFDGLQHISSLTVDQYAYLSNGTGFSSFEVATDKLQKSSRWLSFMIPVIWISSRIKGFPYGIHGGKTQLLGRLLFFTVTK
jgi:SAM-dependent methyltransferase